MDHDYASHPDHAKRGGDCRQLKSYIVFSGFLPPNYEPIKSYERLSEYMSRLRGELPIHTVYYTHVGFMIVFVSCAWAWLGHQRMCQLPDTVPHNTENTKYHTVP